MPVLPIRVMGDPVLREKARSVEKFDRSLQELAADMIETMYEAHGVGLAAPQVGVSLRLFVFDDEETGPQAVVNPVLSGFDGGQDEEEGCLSVPGIYFPVHRANNVKVKGFDVQGHPVELDAAELLARIMQHETDHIDGILFLDRLSEENRRLAMKQIREQELGLIPKEPESSAAL